MTNLADELERLAKEATPGEWSLSEPDREGYAYIDAPTHGALARVVWHMEDDKYLGRPSVREQANAALIVALRNALPQIISALRSLTGEGEPVAWRARNYTEEAWTLLSDRGHLHPYRRVEALYTRPVACPDREAVASEIIRAIEAYENSAIPESWDAAKTAAFNAADRVIAFLSGGGE